MLFTLKQKLCQNGCFRDQKLQKLPFIMYPSMYPTALEVTRTQY